MKKRLLSLLLALCLVAGTAANAAFTPTKTYTPGQFTDVPAGVWYGSSVQKVYELGLMSGNSAATFNPTGMFTVAGRMHSLSHGGNGVLPAGSGAWYQGAVDYCLKNGVITSNQFDSYTRSATRAEMAGVIRAALPDDQWAAINSVSALPDVSAGTDYAQAIFDLYNAGVFTGSDDYGMFQPYAYITRAEVAAIVARCADPAQRKTLNLKPLSQREAPVIPGNKFGAMSNGRLRFQDPNTEKWGFLDGNGNAVVPAQYDDAYSFTGGYAKVKKNGYWGLINTAGAVVVPLEQDELRQSSSDPQVWFARKDDKYALVNSGKLVTGYVYDSIGDLGSGLYRVWQRQGSLYGAINAAGKVIVPILYSTPRYGNAVETNSYYVFGNLASNGGTDVYDLNGTKLGHFDGNISYKKGNPLLGVQEGNKWAVAIGTKKITEAVYDSVEPMGSSFAQVKYGDLAGLVGLNGEVVPLGTYDGYAANGDYFAAYKPVQDGEHLVVVGNATGVMYTGTYSDSYFDYLSLSVYEDAGSFYCHCYSGYHSTPVGVIFQKDGQSSTAYQAYDEGLYYHWQDEDGKYVMLKNGKLLGPWYYYSQDGHWYQISDDGGYGYWDTDGTVSEPIYDWKGEAEEAYKAAYYNQPENQHYYIRNNSAGKPTVFYGNENYTGYPVIEFYKNNMYYDEIEALGEGYYACRFNTTWYLLHA